MKNDIDTIGEIVTAVRDIVGEGFEVTAVQHYKIFGRVSCDLRLKKIKVYLPAETIKPYYFDGEKWRETDAVQRS